MKRHKKESTLQKDIRDYIEAAGFYSVNVIVASDSGTSDIVACILGKFVSIEVKLTYNKPSPLQLAALDVVQLAGGVTLVAYCLEDVKFLIATLRKEAIEACRSTP